MKLSSTIHLLAVGVVAIGIWRQNWWLAGLGAILLSASLGTFAWLRNQAKAGGPNRSSP